MKIITIDQNYDGKPIAVIKLQEDTVLTYDSILVPEVGEDGRILSFSIIDRDQLITKEKRAEKYGDKNWKERLKI